MFGRTRKEITIRTDYEQSVWTLEVDQCQLEQVLLNLCVNAGHAMPEGGNLHLRTRNVVLRDEDVRPFGMEPGKYVRIAVEDSGIGMDQTTQRRIFEPFFTTKEMGRGTGLGLASAYGIIKNHGGFIDVESKKGEGTTFSIYLPASEKEIPNKREVPSEILRGTESVLLVDDEEMIIEVGQEILQEMGYKVLSAKTGQEAVDLYAKNKGQIDMVILDMIMPGMGGGETFDKIKEMHPEAKVLLSSGYSVEGQASEILARGCNGFIQKPFSVKKLSQTIRQVLDS
jgi:two-component system cell cycle sensor histidine kinase/response regulator CckA